MIFSVIDRAKKRILYMLMLMLLLTLAGESSFAAGQQQPGGKKHFLWSVSKGRGTVYLLGSIHVMKKDSYPLPPGIESIYDCCRKIAFETDLDGMAGLALQRKMMSLARYPGGQTLKKSISPGTYRELERKVSGTALKMKQLNLFRPWFVSQQVASVELSRMGFNPALGVDRYFYDRAKKDRKEMIFFETGGYQINLFAGLGRMQQEMLLKQILKDLEVVSGEFSNLISAWESGDVLGLEEIIIKSYREYPVIYKRFFTNRNKRWLQKIERMLRQEDDVLVIVGAGHLTGKDGLPALLGKRGYRVEQR